MMGVLVYLDINERIIAVGQGSEVKCNKVVELKPSTPINITTLLGKKLDSTTVDRVVYDGSDR